MNCSTPGLPVPHHLPEFAQVHVHRWCCPAISSSDTLFFCPQSFPASGTFPVSFLFASDDQNTGTSASAPVLPMNIQGWSPLWLPNLISLLSNGLSGSLQHHGSKASILWHSAFFTVHLSQPYVTTGKTIVLTVRTFVGRVKSAFRHTVWVCHLQPVRLHCCFSRRHMVALWKTDFMQACKQYSHAPYLGDALASTDPCQPKVVPHDRF